MILKSLELKDFRVFKGTQRIDFSKPGSKNVTVIHAENGHGKSSILNAFLWSMYGILNSDFEQGYSALIHEDLVREFEAGRIKDEPYAMVKLTLEHEKRMYFISRKITYSQQRNTPPNIKGTLNVTQRNLTTGNVAGLDDDETNSVTEQQHIRSILPVEMAKFLFFGGESIDRFAADQSERDIAKAIKDMMGLDLIQRTISDLKSGVRPSFQREFRDNTTPESKAEIDKKDKLELQITQVGAKIENWLEEIKSAEAGLKVVNEKLEKNEAVSQKQVERSRLEDTIVTDRTLLKQTTTNLKNKINDSGYTIFTKAVIDDARNLMKSWRDDRSIPSKIQDTLLRELIDQQECICGRELKPGSEACKKITDLLLTAGDSAFNDAISNLDQTIAKLESSSAFNDIDTIRRQRTKLITDIEYHTGLVKEISEEIGNNQDDDVQGLERARDGYESSISNNNIEIIRAKRDIEGFRKMIDEVNKKISQLDAMQRTSSLAKKRLDLVDETIQTLEEILEEEINQITPDLERSINKNLSSTITQYGYTACIDKEFTITVKNRYGNIVGRNAALRQTLALCFIGSLIDLSSKRAQIPTILSGLTGSVYPLVMDSPFGEFDQQHTRGICRIIPKLSNQVILLVNNRAYNADVKDEFENSDIVGERYYIKYHNFNSRPESCPVLNINNEAYSLFERTEGQEFSTIIKITN